MDKESENKKDDQQIKKEGETLELEQLKQKLVEADKLKEEYLAGWQRQKADFLNYQKDVMRQTQELVKFANEDLIKDILIVLDSFDISINSLRRDKGGGQENVIRGVELIKSQLEDVLRKNGLEKIKTMGEQFNPEFHEAIEEVEQDGEPGIIIGEMLSGYKLNGRVIRPARVKVIKSNQ